MPLLDGEKPADCIFVRSTSAGWNRQVLAIPATLPERIDFSAMLAPSWCWCFGGLVLALALLTMVLPAARVVIMINL